MRLQQQEFVAAYVGQANGNGTDAARRAGYRGSDAVLAVAASRLLRNAKVAARIDAYRDEIKAKGIAHQQNRIDEQNERWELLKRVRSERASDPVIAALPAGGTGLVVGRLKKVTHEYVTVNAEGEEEGESTQATREVWEHEIDAAYLREILALEKQVGIETGQDASAGGVTVTVAPTILREFVVTRDVPPAPVRDDVEDDGAGDED